MLTRCVSFVEDQFSGFQLIQRSGVSYQALSYGSLGEAICQLDGEPASAPANCFGTGFYWQYLHWVGTRWVPSQVGASEWILHDGDLDGWHYASGLSSALPGLTLAQVCAPPQRPAPSTSTIEPTTAPTPSPSPPATASPPMVVLVPTANPAPSAKPVSHPSAAGPLGVLGGSLLVLAGLTAWNLWRRGP